MAWKNQAERRKNTPTAQAVYKYWSKKELPIARNNEFTLLEEGTCFACGIFYALQRAHIIPICDDGDNTVENIHLLCLSCHSRSEGNKRYWTWLAYMRTHEWKYRWEWAIKILEMNGVNIDEEAEKFVAMDWESGIKFIKNLLLENRIHVSDGCLGRCIQ